MPVYLVQGCQGTLSRDMRRVLGFVAQFYKEKYSQPVFLHSIENGTSHLDSSLHYDGDAIDSLYPTSIVSWKQLWRAEIVSKELRWQIVENLQRYLNRKVGHNLVQVIVADFHIHLEWDPVIG